MPPRPDFVQSAISTMLLLLLLTISIPISLVISVYTLVFRARRIGRTHEEAVLVTGARTQKSLTISRMFWKAGYRVVLADEAEWSRFAASRFSRSIDRFYTLPDPTKDHAKYESAIRSIVQEERIRLWVPGSSAAGTLNDARVADVVRARDGVKVFIQSEREIERLHNKDLFGDLVQQLGFTVPESKLVDSIDQALDFVHSDERRGRKYILKCTALDDQGRSDMTRLPFATREDTRRHFERMPRRISKASPYVLQQYISGYEYCTHCHAVDGEMQSFLACPSSDMLMRYVDCRSIDSEISGKAEEWTRTFLRTWKAKLDREGATYRLTGHFSFDFIVENGTLYPIECNPRIHTAVVLLSDRNPVEMAKSYFGQTATLIKPRASKKAYSWMFHSIPIALARAVLPSYGQHLLHPLLPAEVDSDPLAPAILPVTYSPQTQSTSSMRAATGNKPDSMADLTATIKAYVTGVDADPMLDQDDPIPFLAQHLMWLWLLGRTVFVRGQGWSRLNVSTSRIFTC